MLWLRVRERSAHPWQRTRCMVSRGGRACADGSSSKLRSLLGIRMIGPSVARCACTRVLVGVKEDNHGPCRYVPAFRSLGSVQWTGVLCINSLGRSDVRRTEIALWEYSEYPREYPQYPT